VFGDGHRDREALAHHRPDDEIGQREDGVPEAEAERVRRGDAGRDRANLIAA
jgi:hypothetical protein